MERVLLNVLLTGIALLFLSCNNEDRVEIAEVDRDYSKSLSNLREKVLVLAEEQTKKGLKSEETGEEKYDFEMTDEKALFYINSLNAEACDLFYSLGMTSEDIIEFNDHDIVLGAMALMVYNSQYEEANSSRDVLDCVSRALVGISFTNWAIAGKITTKAMGMIFLKQVARKALGPIGVAWTIYDFVTCMAEIDYNQGGEDEYVGGPDE